MAAEGQKGDVYDNGRRGTCMTRIAGYITHGTRYNEKRSSFLNSFSSAPPGARTLDPNIKSVVLYQLS